MYIQDKVEEYSDEVFDLLDNGAHIFFCGLKGMMPGITEMLEKVATEKVIHPSPLLPPSSTPSPLFLFLPWSVLLYTCRHFISQEFLAATKIPQIHQLRQTVRLSCSPALYRWTLEPDSTLLLLSGDRSCSRACVPIVAAGLYWTENSLRQLFFARVPT